MKMTNLCLIIGLNAALLQWFSLSTRQNSHTNKTIRYTKGHTLRHWTIEVRHHHGVCVTIECLNSEEPSCRSLVWSLYIPLVPSHHESFMQGRRKCLNTSEPRDYRVTLYSFLWHSLNLDTRSLQSTPLEHSAILEYKLLAIFGLAADMFFMSI